MTPASDLPPAAEVRHLLAGYDLSTDRLDGHVVKRKGRRDFLAFARYLRSLHPREVRIAIILDKFSAHLATQPTPGSATGSRRTSWSWPLCRSWLRAEPNRGQFTAPRYFALDGTDHPSHREQASMIRRYIVWRNAQATDPRLRKVIRRSATIKWARLPDAVLASIEVTFDLYRHLD